MMKGNITVRSVRASVSAAALIVAFLCGAGTAFGEVRTAANDSLARALATFWGTSLRTADLTPTESENFLRGVEEALNDTTKASNAYSKGVGIGLNFLSGLNEMESLGMKVDRAQFAKAVIAVLKGGNVGFTAKSAGEFIDRQIAPLTGARDATAFTAESQAAFVAEAAKAEGAVVTPSGLVFKVITEGEGEFPTEADRVDIEYVARLSDGSVFDETEQPVNFDLVHLVDGFKEGLKMMRPGGEYRIVFPASLGYGERGAGDVIPPGAALDFRVRLLGVDRGSGK